MSISIKKRDYEDIRISTPWGSIAGRWYGNRDLRPILAIHGWLDNLGTWDTLIPLLPAHIGFLCIDLPGHGRSSKYPKGVLYHVLDYVHIIIRVMKEYKWQKVSLMAHSMGSIISFIYTTLYPRTVDMLIAIDVIKPVFRTKEYELKRFAVNIEKTLVEDERMVNMDMFEPPSYSYEEMEQVLYEGSGKSVNIENCKYLLERSIVKSKKYPDKYYFSRDGRVKFYTEFNSSPALTLEMAKKIRNVPYLVVKGSLSNFINEDSNPFIELLRQNNPHFEMHVINGTHHVHLNNPTEVSKVLTPFINAYRPALLNSWSVDDENIKENTTTIDETNRKTPTTVSEAKIPLKWRKSQL